MQFLDDTQRDAVLRSAQLTNGDLTDRLTAAETRLNEDIAAGNTSSVVTSTDPGIVNQLRNTDCKNSVNTWFEPTAGTGKTAHELAYFFTHAIDATALFHTDNLTNPSDTVNTSIKDVDHPDFSSNIQNPKWDKEFGVITFGKTNTIDMPLGNFTSDGTSFVDVSPLRQGDPMFLTFKLARKSIYIRPRGRIYAGIYNNKSGFYGFLKGADYGLSGARRGVGTPAVTVSTQYMIAIETDQGYTLVSQIVTIADSPDLASMNINCYNLLQWLYIAGTLRARIFRKFGTDNVFEINENPQGQNSYPDKGAVSATDTGSTLFPTFADQKTAIESYWASSEVQLQNVAVDGVDSKWDEFRIWLAMLAPPSDIDEPFVRIGLTLSAGIMVRDAVADGSVNVASAVAQFTSAMNGKDFILKNPATGESHTGTVTFDTDSNIILSAAAPFSASNCTLEIQDCVDDAFELDKIGLSFSSGVWTPHPDDNGFPDQSPASQPPNSNQGDGSIGSGGGDPIYGGGSGGIQCVLDDTLIHVKGEDRKPVQVRASDVEITDQLWFGRKSKRGTYLYNEIEEINYAAVKEIVRIETENGAHKLPCTESHRIIDETRNLTDGTPVAEISKGDIIFHFCESTEKFKPEIITKRELEKGNFRVVSFKLKPKKRAARTGHLMMCNSILCHNRKFDPVMDQPIF